MADELIDIDTFESDLKRAKGDDPAEKRARAELTEFFRTRSNEVFFSRQIEIFFEGKFFHWITARALRTLVGAGIVKTDARRIPSTGGTIHLFWHRAYRYYRRAAEVLVRSVSEYADPNVAAAVGIHGESMVLAGFAESEFVLKGRGTNRYGGRSWVKTNHDLDFIFVRDGVAYGVEVKNTLGYPDYDEVRVKTAIAKYLDLVPMFVVRMMPKTWINELWKAGGFTLILKYQLYPYSHRKLASRIAGGLGLPIDSPRKLSDGTMKRFLEWHFKRLKA